MNLYLKKTTIALSVLLLCGSVLGRDSLTLHDYVDSLSYVLGRDIGMQLKEIGTPLKIEKFSAGIEQALNGEASSLDSSTTDGIRRKFAEFVKEQISNQQQESADKNRTASKQFLDKNKKVEGVVTTASGLQYIVLKKGDGPLPSPTDSVQVYYRGMLMDNTVIDSTTSGQPAELDLARTIPGLTEGIQLMKVGSKYRFFLPPELAYGSTGAPPAIPPESVLIFDIELLAIPGSAEKSGTLY